MIKKLSVFIWVVPVLLTAGGCCDTRQVRTAKAYGSIDATPEAAEKGYVEFYTTSLAAPVPIFQVDAKGRPQILGAVGLARGERYSKVRYEADVTEKLRVAVPPGTRTFVLERDGQRVQVPVVAGQVTPVQIHYARLEHADMFDLYTISTDVLPAKGMTELPPPTSKESSKK